MILKCLGWILLYCLKSTLNSRSHSAQGLKDRVKPIPPREEREEVVAPGFSQVAPCLNGCIGASAVRWKDKGSVVKAGSDSWTTSFCLGGSGHEDREIQYPGSPQ
jgi:hypothetical protein